MSQAIYQRVNGDDAKSARLNRLLKTCQWRSDNFLHRQMRKRFSRGRTRHRNQFVVRPEGKLTSTLHIATKYGADIVLTANTNGDGVDLSCKSLRIFLCDDHVDIHYAFEKGAGAPCGTQTVGVNKGCTEALDDSDRHFQSRQFGAILRAFTEATRTTGQARGKKCTLG